jgi:hypothetical protein
MPKKLDKTISILLHLAQLLILEVNFDIQNSMNHDVQFFYYSYYRIYILAL